MRWLVAQKNQVRNGEIYRYIAGEPCTDVCRCHCCYLYWLDVVHYAQKQPYMRLLGLGRYCLGGPCACAGTTFTQQQVCIGTYLEGGCNERVLTAHTMLRAPWLLCPSSCRVDVTLQGCVASWCHLLCTMLAASLYKGFLILPSWVANAVMWLWQCLLHCQLVKVRSAAIRLAAAAPLLPAFFLSTVPTVKVCWHTDSVP